jgi:hypothetical protein
MAIPNTSAPTSKAKMSWSVLNFFIKSEIRNYWLFLSSPKAVCSTRTANSCFGTKWANMGQGIHVEFQKLVIYGKLCVNMGFWGDSLD